jgi:hypothetical protein
MSKMELANLMLARAKENLTKLQVKRGKVWVYPHLCVTRAWLRKAVINEHKEITKARGK